MRRVASLLLAVATTAPRPLGAEETPRAIGLRVAGGYAVPEDPRFAVGARTLFGFRNLPPVAGGVGVQVHLTEPRTLVFSAPVLRFPVSRGIPHWAIELEALWAGRREDGNWHGLWGAAGSYVFASYAKEWVGYEAGITVQTLGAYEDREIWAGVTAGFTVGGDLEHLATPMSQDRLLEVLAQWGLRSVAEDDLEVQTYDISVRESYSHDLGDVLAGTCVGIAAASKDGSNIDLEIVDSNTGDVLAADRLLDAVPIVNYCVTGEDVRARITNRASEPTRVTYAVERAGEGVVLRVEPAPVKISQECPEVESAGDKVREEEAEDVAAAPAAEEPAEEKTTEKEPTEKKTAKKSPEERTPGGALILKARQMYQVKLIDHSGRIRIVALPAAGVRAKAVEAKEGCGQPKLGAAWLVGSTDRGTLDIKVDEGQVLWVVVDQTTPIRIHKKQ